MDNLITPQLVSNIVDQLREVLTIPETSLDHKDTIEALFDGEEALRDSMDDIIKQAIAEVNQHANNAGERNKAIRKHIVAALLTGLGR